MISGNYIFPEQAFYVIEFSFIYLLMVFYVFLNWHWKLFEVSLLSDLEFNVVDQFKMIQEPAMDIQQMILIDVGKNSHYLLAG